MKNQFVITIIAVILYLIYSNETVLNTINKLFIGFLGESKTDTNLKHNVLHSILFGLSLLIILLIFNSQSTNSSINSYYNKPYTFENDDDDVNDLNGTCN